MHPFLKSPLYVLLMGLLWSPIVLCAVILESGLSGLPFIGSLILIGPAIILELFIVLSLWFPCKAISFEKYNMIRFIVRHAFSATVMIAVWLMLSGLYSELLDLLTKDRVWRERFNETFPLLIGIGLFLYFLFSLIYYLILTLEKSRKAEQQALKSRLETSRAELVSLKTSIHPHFLFNSMAALSTLTQTSPDKAYQMCLQLSDFLRYSLDYSKQDWVPIKDEIEHIENYLEIEKIRLGERLNLDFQADPETLGENIPPFTLLPLVENAVKHGFQQSLETRTLYLRIQKIPDWLLIDVKNSYDPMSRAAESGGFGLKGLKKRLSNAYKDRSTMLVKKEFDTFSVSIRVPLIEGEKDE
ncbi:MAG: histidine kinase [Candidatus Aminicenantes bacterium]|nr:histidine kinase [Candidatus Aminicenantes bacterium]